MNSVNADETDRRYFEQNGLDRLVPMVEPASRPGDVFHAVRPGETAVPPELRDLVQLHRFIRRRKSFTVLEFGVGYSTLVMADALAKNRNDWEALKEKPTIRNRFMFQLFSVDASKRWIEETKRRFPDNLVDRVHFHFSSVKVGTFNGQLCHYYQSLPDIIPDFIYLDGPNPKDVKGKMNGLSFQCDERTVMAADLLLMEPTFLPGTFIAVDGRTNNARFIERNFKRRYDTHWDKEGDVTTFELVEERLGNHNRLGSDFF